MSLRQHYEQFGVDKYYIDHSDKYVNYHYDQVKDLLIKNEYINGSILDLCCGNGEVTQVLQDLGHTNIKGCDPYTYQHYIDKTKKECYQYNFVHIMNNKLNEKFDTIICSFAMHLCPIKDLSFMISNLTFNKLIIISPHKRPNLDNILKLVHTDFSLTQVGKKVYLKVYEIN
jgi:SAM-dependent methyltransferase